MKKANVNNVSVNTAPGKSRIASVATASPPYVVDQSTAEAFLKEHYRDRLSSKSLKLLHKIFDHPSVQRRHFALDDPACLVNEDQDSRITRFTEWGITLSHRAVVDALAQAGLTVDAVSGLVVNTCTGYICPGLSTYLIEKLGLSRTIRALDLVGSGCGGAIPNLQVCEDMLNGNGDGVVVSVAVEICSSTFQISDDLGLLLSNALFGDGAGAAVVWNRPQGLSLVSSGSRYVPEQRDTIRYVYKNGQLHNQLSLSLPELVSKAAGGVVTDLLQAEGLRVADVKHWALHSGGEKIIDAVKAELGLSESQVRATRDVLMRYGNMSSPTVWYVLRELMDSGIEPGEWCMMVAFGAGLSAHAFLLRAE